MQDANVKNVSWWQFRSKLERRLICILVLLISLIGVLLLVFIVLETSKANLCLSKDCLKVTAKFLTSLDETANPCDDFQQFACGKWLNLPANNHPAELYLAEIKAHNRHDQIFTSEIQIANSTSETNHAMSYQNLKYIFDACMNRSAINEGDKYLKQLLLGGLGGWPIITPNWEESNFNWIASIIKLSNLGFKDDAFFSMTIYKNLTRNKNYPLLAPPNLDRKVLDKDFRNINEEFLKNTLQLFGVEPKLKTYDINFLSDFTDELIKVANKHQQSRKLEETDRLNLISIAELDRITPAGMIPSWCGAIKEITGYTMPAEQMVIANISGYLQDLNNLLKKTPRKVQANYMLWEALKDMHMWFNVPNSPRTTLKARSNLCIDATNKILPLVANQILSLQVSQEQRNKVSEMVANIKAEIQEMIEEIEWLDLETKEKAIENLKNVKTFIAGKLSGSTDFKLTYAMQPIRENNIILAIMRTKRAVAEFFYKILFEGKPEDLMIVKLLSLDHMANAYYVRNNYIGLASGLFQEPIYSTEVPDYLNYAVLGHLIGHELTHAFQFSTLHEGEFNRWSSKTRNKYNKDRLCLTQMYQNYTLERYGVVLNGSAVLDESVADIWGTYAAWRALMKYHGNNGGSTGKLPGHEDHSPGRLFWIALARYYCDPHEADYVFNKRNGTQQRNVVNKEEDHEDVYALPSFRIYAPIANSDYFARTFNCPIGSSNVNPPGKCAPLL